MFEVYIDCLMNFKYTSYLVWPFTHGVHESVYEIQIGVPSICIDKFPKSCLQNHFLVGPWSYKYQSDDLSHEKKYLKNKFTIF